MSDQDARNNNLIFSYQCPLRLLLIKRWLSQTDRASAFVVDLVKILPTSSLVTMQNLAALSHTVCAHEGDPKNGGRSGPAPLGQKRG